MSTHYYGHSIHKYELKLDESAHWDRSVQKKGKFTQIFLNSNVKIDSVR